MRCLRCGKECGDENFCSHCGAPLIRENNVNEQNVPNTPEGFAYTPYENKQAVSDQQYNYSNYTQQPAVPKSNIGIFAFILGILGLFFSCITAVGLILDIAAIVCGVMGVKKKHRQVCAVTGIICGAIGILFFFVSLSGNSSDANTEISENTPSIVSTEFSSEVPTEKTDNASNTEEKKEEKVTPKKDTSDPEKEFKKSCQKFNYKKIARNPEDYVGQNFKVTVRISSISEEGLFSQAYMKAFTDDGSDTYWDHMIYIFDDQDEDSDSYLNVLEDDIITVYGTFEGTEDTTNILNGEKSKDIALHMKYAKLIKE